MCLLMQMLFKDVSSSPIHKVVVYMIKIIYHYVVRLCLAFELEAKLITMETSQEILCT